MPAEDSHAKTDFGFTQLADVELDETMTPKDIRRAER
jgi:hypothetical protein